MLRIAPLKKHLIPFGFCLLLVSWVLAYAGCRNSPPTLIPGNRHEGILKQDDTLRNEMPRGPEARWSLDGRKGQGCTITAESWEFDVYLLLLNPDGSQIASANGNGELFSSRIAIVLPEDGRYTVVVCGSSADHYGTYWVSTQDGMIDTDWSVPAAEARYESGREWGKRMANHRALSWTHLQLGRFFALRGQRDESDRYYQLSLSEAEQGDAAVCRWAATLERGRLFARRRQYEQAADQLQRSMELSKDLTAAREAETITLIELGNLTPSTTSEDATRSAFYRTATANAAEYALPSTLVTLYTALSDFLQLQDREKAFDYAEKAFGLCRGLSPVLEMKAMHALAGGYLFLKQERSDEGLGLAAELRNRAEQVGSPDDQVVALTLMSMAKYARNEIDETIELAGRAYSLTSADDENPNPRRIALQLQADGEMARQNYDAALSSCLKALQTVESAWARESIEAVRRELLSQARAICTQIISNLYELNAKKPSSEYARQAFDYAERSRSRSLLEQLFAANSHDIRLDPLVLSRDQELAEKLSAVRGQIAVMKTSSYASRDELYNLLEQRASLIAQRLRVRAELGSSVGSAYGAAHLSPLDVEQAQKKLAAEHPDGAILYYQLGVLNSFLIALTPRDCRLVKLPDWTSISKQVAEWRAAMSNLQGSPESAGVNLTAYIQVARRLYDMLIKPVEQTIRGRELIIVPSDALCRLAFEALVTGEPGPLPNSPEYLVQRHSVSYIPSVSVLAEIENRPERRTGANQMLLLGDASTGSGSSELTLRGEGSNSRSLQRLPAARDEVLRIAELAARNRIRTTVWLGSEANEAKVKSADLASFRFIHIATHGITDHLDGEASALTMAPDSKGNQDGVLTSDEVSKLKLDADLVVLSGCETGIGEEAGAEGIVGFNRTFLTSGARCVCGSLWPVEDSWTEKLMVAFYKGFMLKGYNKAQSIRLAKLGMVQLGANPSQWAAFVLAGSPR